MFNKKVLTVIVVNVSFLINLSDILDEIDNEIVIKINGKADKYPVFSILKLKTSVKVKLK